MVNEPGTTRAQWDARIAKWDYGIDVAKATEADLANYTETKVYKYLFDKRNDDNLWECYQADFKNFTKDTFGKLLTHIT